jgi:hypothetical protein
MAPFSNFDLRKPSINTVANSLKYIYYILNSKSYIVVIVLSPLIGFVRVFPLGARYEVPETAARAVVGGNIQY